MTPKTQSILSYLGILWLIAYLAGKGKRNDISSYHLKQGFGLILVSIIFNIATGIIGFVSPSIAGLVGYIGILFLILMVLGIIHAINDVKKPLPVIGKSFEKQFDFLDK